MRRCSRRAAAALRMAALSSSTGATRGGLGARAGVVDGAGAGGGANCSGSLIVAVRSAGALVRSAGALVGDRAGGERNAGGGDGATADTVNKRCIGADSAAWVGPAPLGLDAGATDSHVGAGAGGKADAGT